MLRTPEPFASLIDALMERDRVWFEQHPDAEFYRRAFVPGELHPLEDPPAGSWMIVVRLGPGLRMRRFERGNAQ